VPEYKPVLDNIYEQEYTFNKKYPEWCHPDFDKDWPPTKKPKRV
jgi:hypothetical protein